MERLRRQRLEESYRMYVTEQLRLIPQSSYLIEPWHRPDEPKRPDRSAQEIVDSVILNAGLEVIG